MTTELAQLLDGEVAARWGRPPISRDGNEWVHVCPCGAGIGMTSHTVAAIWLAHLIIECAKMNLFVTLQPPLTATKAVGAYVATYPWDARCIHSEHTAPSHLEALAQAMLAIPAPVNA
jgi:hypothetical protein